MYIVLHDGMELDRLHAELAANGARIASPPAEREWAPYAFIAEDLDGNQLIFVGDSGHEIP